MDIMNERKLIMSEEEIKYNLIDNIMSYLKYELTEKLKNKTNHPIFNVVLEIMGTMNEENYTYTLKDIDDKLFDKLINEIVNLFI